jgi:hypothetical protein
LPDIKIQRTKKCTKTVSALRREKVVALKKGLESQQSNGSSSALQASYLAAHLLAKKSKPLSNGKFIRKYLQNTVQEVSPEKNLFLIL